MRHYSQAVLTLVHRVLCLVWVVYDAVCEITDP